MSYIAHLKSLSAETRKSELKSKILKAQKCVLNDQSRTKLLDERDLNCWDEIDELKLEQIRFDDKATECIVEIYWLSSGSHDEDDERKFYGNATATIADDESISFSDMSADFDDGARAKRRDPHEPLNAHELQQQQDAQDYTEYRTKDW